MTLICNGYRLGYSPHRLFTGSLTTIYNGMSYSKNAKTGAIRNITAGPGIIDDTTSLPTGTRHPHAWMLARVSGGLSSRNRLLGIGTIAATGQLGKNAEADLTGDGGISSAIGGLIVSLIADLTGDGDITAADLQAFLNAVAALSGSGDAEATLTGIAALLSDIEASGTLSGSTLTAVGDMASDIVSYGELTPENLASAVWSAVAAAYNDAGTMGEKLNDAGSAGNPWAALLADNNDEGTFGERVQKLLTLAKYLGLK